MTPYLEKAITYALTPAKWAYGFGVWVHNWLYESGLKPQKSFDVPVISVGNLTVGGTGKTPHVEYIVEALCHKYNIAVLSRGYKRKTKGFILASPTSTPEQIGDEPYQINRKFGDRVRVAVVNNRKKGIERLLKMFPEINLVILDDAYQYRDVKPLVSILLLDSHRPVDKDTLLPLGRLREPQHATERADMIIITKCPDYLSPIDYRTISKTITTLGFQKLFFSGISYREILPVFNREAKYSFSLESLTEEDSVLLVTGIAHPRAFVKYFKKFPFKVKVMRFPDHHNFTKNDLKNISRKFKGLEGKRKLIITTEKDSVRLLHNPYYPYTLKPLTYYLPIKIRMHAGIDGLVLEDELEYAIRTRHLNQ